MKNRNSYNGLDDLLANEVKANAYFAMLPNFVQKDLRGKRSNINSFDAMCDLAENAFYNVDI